MASSASAMATSVRRPSRDRRQPDLARLSREERNLAWDAVAEKIRIDGSPRLLLAFGRCFPSPGVRHDPRPLRPVPSRLSPSPVPYWQNDAATGKIKWSGTRCIDRDRGRGAQRQNLPTRRTGGGRVPFQFLPGQFLTLAIEPFGVCQPRSYTIASGPRGRELDRNHSQTGSTWPRIALAPSYGHARRPPQVLAPNGTFTFTGEEAKSIVLIGGGVGWTPLMSIARSLSGRIGRATCICS